MLRQPRTSDFNLYNSFLSFLVFRVNLTNESTTLPYMAFLAVQWYQEGINIHICKKKKYMLESRSSSAFETFKEHFLSRICPFLTFIWGKKKEAKQIASTVVLGKTKDCGTVSLNREWSEFFLSEGLDPFTQNRDTKFTIKMIFKTWATLNPLQKA